MTGTASSVDESYRLGRACHEAGNLVDAKAHYLDVLRLDPDHADALHMLGNIDLREGRLDDAERVLRRAVELAPSAPGYNTTLGNALRAAGRPAEAAAAYRRELSLRPDFAAAHNQLGLVLMDLGNAAEALKSFRQALSHVPSYTDACVNVGRALNNLRRLPEAEAAFEQALRLDPDLAEAHNGLGHVRRARGDATGALTSFERAVACDSGHLPSQRNLAAALVDAGRTAEAIDVLADILKLAPDDATNHVNLGVALHNAGKLAEAVRSYRTALDLAPDDTDARASLAAALRSMGRGAEAADAYSLVLERQPGHGKAVAGLAAVLESQGRYGEGIELLSPVMRTGPVTPDIVATYAGLLAGRGDLPEATSMLERALDQQGLASDPRAMLLFKLGDVLHGQGDHDGAFERYAEANATRQVRFDPAGRQVRVDAVIEAFDTARFASLPRAPVSGPSPIFVVGMPHSGVLVADALLDAHPNVVSAGAPRDIAMIASKLGQAVPGRPYPACIHDVTLESLAHVAGLYVERLLGTDDDRRVCDARWVNYEHLGLIALMFPGAPVIHCVRDPDDIALACYFGRSYGNAAVPFSHDLAHIGAYYRIYLTLMRHWTDTLGLAMLDMPYDRLMDDPTGAADAMLAHAGLARDDGWELPDVPRPARHLARHYPGRLAPFHAALRDG